VKTYSLRLSDLMLHREEIYLNLGYGGLVPDEPFVEMIDQMLEHMGEFCVPCTGYLLLPGKMIDKSHLEINHVPIKVGQVINKYLSGSTHFAVFVATAGEAFDRYLEQLKMEGDIVSEFLAYSIGSEIAEAAVRFVTEKIIEEADEFGFKTTHSYCPGYCSWHVREQQSLFSLLPEKPCGVELNESSLMHPVKSVSGIIGLGKEVEQKPHACELCSMVTCFKRKTVPKSEN